MLWSLPVLLLITVALIHRVRVHVRGQSAWKGGGFGMFSEIPHTAVVPVLWRVKTDQSVEEIPIDPSPPWSRESVLPTRKALEGVGASLLKREWQRCGRTAHEWRAPASEGERFRADGVILRVLRIAFDGRAGSYRSVESEPPMFVQRLGPKP